MTQIAKDLFSSRHIGISPDDLPKMLKAVGVDSLDQLMYQAIPDNIRNDEKLNIPEALSEKEYLDHIRSLADKNEIFKSYIGQGYYDTITPSVILRNIFENPGWYTQYTPYQAEISQGRLEALLNFQTMVSDLTQMELANASLLDEATAAAEAMAMFYAIRNKKEKGETVNNIFVDNKVFEQTVDVLKSRAEPLGIEIVRDDWHSIQLDKNYFGAIIQYPDKEGKVPDYQSFASLCTSNEIYLTVAADILSLALLEAPGKWGADAVVGSTQRLGIPMGFGGPHAAYFATKEKFKRQIPGRIIGVSQDRLGNKALRMALQTREQHIKREKATSNICTAQALLAIMAGMYAVYHGPEGLKNIAKNINNYAASLSKALKNLGFDILHDSFFDTIAVKCDDTFQEAIKISSEEKKINFYYTKNSVQISLDETTSKQDLNDIIDVFSSASNRQPTDGDECILIENVLATSVQRRSAFLTHPVFHSYRSETQMMRYIKQLENRDISLVHSMIPLGSCTMKLNAATQLIPVSWPEFGKIHPFAPQKQSLGYREMIQNLESYLCTLTGFTACSLQPNSGAQGEYTGLMAIRAYHQDRGDTQRKIAIIPSSAHGTNPASAIMAGMRVVVVQCDDLGNIDVADLRQKAESYQDELAALMVTYPSTHGVFEVEIKEICQIIHDKGGLVYMDGANMNAQVGLTSPGYIGADVCHLNLHKTFAIPHGGGGPGMGPICVNDKLKLYLPNHQYAHCGGEKGISPIAAAPWSSASILLISYAYIRLLGPDGLLKSSQIAILNANYIKAKLENDYSVLYTGGGGRAAHELIIDLRPFKAINVTAEDVAKRLIDYGFHAPTLSFPVAGTIMIEPTESEDLAELDRFCEAMLSIKDEIDEIATGEADEDQNLLKNAPHTLSEIIRSDWDYPYSREKAAFPLSYLRELNKFWPHVARVDNAFGDRNLICSCPPMEVYES